MTGKKPEIRIGGPAPPAPSWERVSFELTEEELKTAKEMNWEWYYNCYLYLDEPISIACKRCGHINLFHPREKWKKCDNCAAVCRRCDKEEDLGEAGDSENGSK